MKKKLRFVALLIILSLAATASARGQSVLFSEDFSGFVTGSHTTPSTSDASSGLDSRMSVPGWTGSLIYSAGGEVKIGTSSTTGWIETPAIDLSASGGNFTIKFDIARWVGDATTVQVLFNDSERGDVLVPTDEFRTITIKCTGEASSGKVKIKGLTKRFYLDNFAIVNDGISTGLPELSESRIRVYPVPATDRITIEGAGNYETIEIIDINGRIVSVIQPSGQALSGVDISGIEDGVYFLRFNKGKKPEIIRFIKSGK